MDNVKQIVAYLEALARRLTDQGGRVQYHMLVTGGAWMLLQEQRRSTKDIDFALIVPPRKARPNRVISIVVQRGGEIATRASNTMFSQAVEAVAVDYGLPLDWLNDECAGYLYDSAPGADAYLWRSFANLLFVYLPTDEYVFTLKLLAYRRQDRVDLQMLLQRLRIRTPEEAQAVLDRFVPESEQAFWEVAKKIKRLFR